jgi:hypothetical protein
MDFLSVYWDISGGVDTKPDASSLDFEHRHNDVAPNHDLFMPFPR